MEWIILYQMSIKCVFAVKSVCLHPSRLLLLEELCNLLRSCSDEGLHGLGLKNIWKRLKTFKQHLRHKAKSAWNLKVPVAILHIFTNIISRCREYKLLLGAVASKGIQRIGETHEIKEIYWKPAIDGLIDWLINWLVGWLIEKRSDKWMHICGMIDAWAKQWTSEREWLSKISDTEMCCVTCFNIRSHRLEQWVLLSSWNSWSVLLPQTTNWG